MNRTLPRLAATIVTAAGFVVALAPHSTASVAHLPLAIAETEVAIANAVIAAAQQNAEDPDLTCANPNVVGSVVVPPVHRPGTASVWGKDQAEGEGHCVSLQGTRYTASLEVFVEWRDVSGDWHRIAGCTSLSTVPASGGVATPVVPPFVCDYDPAGDAAGKPHRVHGILSTTLSDAVYEGYSQVYLSPQEDDLLADDA